MEQELPEVSSGLRRLLAWQGGLTTIMAVLAAILALASALGTGNDVAVRIVAIAVAVLATGGAGLAIVARRRAATVADSHRDMSRRALYDPLTDLPNRHYFQLRFDDMMDHAHKSGGRFAVLFIDGNQLKSINDTHGHDIGDAALATIGARITEALRGSDMAARWGGDEFVVLADRITERAQAALLADRIARSVARPLDLAGGATLHPSVSIGFALYPVDGETAETLFHRADAAMYRAKHAQPAIAGV